VTAAPGAAIVGEMPLIAGAAALVTVKSAALVAEPPGAVTLTGPVVAPLGTLATSSVGLAESIVAVVPLNLSVSWLAVALKPRP
jgi:hypothetical protein